MNIEEIVAFNTIEESQAILDKKHPGYKIFAGANGEYLITYNDKIIKKFQVTTSVCDIREVLNG